MKGSLVTELSFSQCFYSALSHLCTGKGGNMLCRGLTVQRKELGKHS